jgi:ABC-type transport system involved in multi-copper enzyme maturation permease subunit
MIRIIRNERMKYLNLTKFSIQVIILAFAAFVFSVAAHQYGNSVQLVSGSFYLAFLKGGLNGIFLKPLLPILMIISTVSVVADDYTSGSLKFTLVSKIRREKVIGAKMIFLFALTFILMVLAFVITALIGYLLFYDLNSIFHKTFFHIFSIYLLSSVLIFPIIVLTTLISLLCDNYQGALGLSLGVYLVFFTIDNVIPQIKFLSPTGGLSYCNALFISLKNDGIRFLLSALIYVVLLLIINIILFRRKDMTI